MINIVTEENIVVVKGENGGSHHSVLYLQYFQKIYFYKCVLDEFWIVQLRFKAQKKRLRKYVCRTPYIEQTKVKH